MKTVVFAQALLALSVLAAAPGAHPQGKPAVPAIDNDRVTVWDVPANDSQDRTSTRPCVAIRLMPPIVTFFPVCAAEAWRPAPAGSIVIELNDRRLPPLANASGFPNAFPRPGGRMWLENDRVVVWDYTWTTGVPTPMHFHDKDVVVVYLENGALKSTTPDGQSVVNDLSPKMIRFNARDRVHTEELVGGKSRAIITELK